MSNVAPIVYDAVTKEHKPVNAGDKLAPGVIATDNIPGNLLRNDTERGLGVFASDAVSAKEGNALSVDEAGKLYVPTPEIPQPEPAPEIEIISKEPGNYLRYGNDKGAFLDGNDVLSNGSTNLLHIDAVDKKVTLTVNDLVDAGVGGVSKDAFNLLTTGSDGGAMLKPEVVKHIADDQIKEAVQPIKDELTVLKPQVDTNTTAISDLKDRVAGLDSDVEKLGEAIEKVSEAVADVTVVSADANNTIVKGSDGGALLTAEKIVKTVEDAGITKVDVEKLISANDELLFKDGDKLASQLEFTYNPVTGRFEATGAYGRLVASTVIPSAVSALERVDIVKDPVGYAPGTYMHFVFRLTDGTTSDLYVNVNELAVFYSSGDGVIVGADNKLNLDRGVAAEIANARIEAALQPGGDIEKAIGEAVDDINVVSADPKNLISTGSDNGAYVSADTIADAIEEAIKSGDVSIVSDDADNLIVKGSDGGAFVDATKIVVGPSADVGNALSVGTDNKLYLPSDLGEL